jgi:hypothetical protein
VAKTEWSQPGASWWMYRRSPVSARTPDRAPTAAPPTRAPSLEITTATSPAISPRRAVGPSGLLFGAVACGLVVATVIASRAGGQDSVGAWLLPAAGICGAIGFGRRCQRVHPDEPWLPQLLILGAAAKLTASYLRYFTLTEAYEGVGDAARYDVYARRAVAGWIGEGPREPKLETLRQTDFMKWLTSIVYYLFGRSLLGGYMLFGLIALIGSYFWYRAVTRAVPFVDRRLFLIFMMFAPSVVFWPASLGKEALMQLGLGGVAWATALILTGRFLLAAPLMAGCGWLLWVVRPHLLALAMVAAAAAYFLGRARAAGGGMPLTRLLGMVVMGAVAVLTVTTGASFLGVNDLSVDSIEAKMDEQTERSSQGGSAFEHQGNELTPLSLPNGAVTVLFRPFPWEVDSGLQLIASAEAMVVVALIVIRRSSMMVAIRRWRTDPFILYCWVLLALFSVTFSAFANFGLLNRQRSLVLPALYALIAIDAIRARQVTEERDAAAAEPAR